MWFFWEGVLGGFYRRGVGCFVSFFVVVGFLLLLGFWGFLFGWFFVAHFGERLNTVIHSFGITVDKQLSHVRLS